MQPFLLYFKFLLFSLFRCYFFLPFGGVALLLYLFFFILYFFGLNQAKQLSFNLIMYAVGRLIQSEYNTQIEQGSRRLFRGVRRYGFFLLVRDMKNSPYPELEEICYLVKPNKEAEKTASGFEAKTGKHLLHCIK